MQTWVENWVAGTASGGTKTIQLVAPPLKDVGQSRNFPADSAGFAATVYPLVTEYCAGCHSSSSATQQSPFFADEDVETAYQAVKTKINLDSPESSRLVLRLRDEFHNCWDNCTSNAQEMEDAIAAYAATIDVTSVDPALVISRALTMYDGTVASGGSRYEAGQIALWEFKEGSGTTAFDTSGVQPAINLTLSGDIAWVGGWGINIRSGRAQGSTTASRKLHDLITATGQYSIEAWAAPANVNQEEARIVTYSAGSTLRNFTMGQTLYSYDFFNRSSTSDANGSLLQTLDDDEDAQATLQHVVMTYDPVAGRRIYVNGVYTEDPDTAMGGTLGDWDDTFALVLGNEPSGDRQWQGVLRMAAVHNRALTPEQVQQNFDAGVGEKFFLLFDVERPQRRGEQLRALRGQPVRQLQLPVQPADLRQPGSGLDAVDADSGPRAAHRRQRRGAADQPGLPEPGHGGQRGERLLGRHRPGAVEPRHGDPAGEGPGPGRVLPHLRGASATAPTW